MTTFSKVNFKTLNYNSFRPHYPTSFYKILADYATKNDFSVQKAVDLGCGTGVATYPLLNFSDEVIGTDLSAKMIETANSLIDERCAKMGISNKDRIKFITGSAESLTYGADKNKILGNGDVDLITAAQCIHWFQDYPAFFKAIAKSLRPGGTLAFWYYIDPVVVDYKGSEKDSEDVKIAKLEKSTEIISKYLYDDPDFAGPHWEQPGRGIIRNHLEVVNDAIPEDLFTDITKSKFVSDLKGKVYPDADTAKDLDVVQRDIPLSVIRDYLDTGSGYHNYKEARGDKAINIPEQVLKDFETELGWGKDTTVDFVFNSGYTFLKRK